MKKLFTKQYLIIIVAMILLSSKVSIANPIPMYDFDYINLNAGWNLISLDVFPLFGTEPDSVFASLINSNNLQMVTGFQNQTGVFYNPNGPPFLNTLQDLVPGEGYWVKVQNADILIVAGFMIEFFPDFTIDLKTGWNLIGYWPAIPQSTNDAFAPLIAAGILQMVTGYEQGGKFYDPNGPPFLNTLTEIKNSFGYWVKLSADYNEFDYPEPVWECGDLIIDERDGQYYETVHIGTQCWMKENMNIGTMIDVANNQTNNWSFEKYCYENLISNCDIYGGLYQWNEMMQYTTNAELQGICPSGWHIPSDAEWTALTTYVSSQTANLCNSNSTYIGKALAAKTNWTTSTSTCAVGNNLSTNNASGFTALPGGCRGYNGAFGSVGIIGFWWSSTENSTTNAWDRYLAYSSAYDQRGYDDKGRGFSVRCLRD